MALLNATVLGASGFIGSSLRTELAGRGIDCFAPISERSTALLRSLEGRDLGHIFYSIGVTSDFRSRPLDTFVAHVGLLEKILRNCKFKSLTYISSTRLYKRSASTAESASLAFQSNEPDDLYGISKLAGESLCMCSGHRCNVVRLSNVIGYNPRSNDFLPSILKEASTSGRAHFRSSPESEKDFVSLADACTAIIEIGTRGECGIYNVASGSNTTFREIAQALEREGIETTFAPAAPLIHFPPIEIAKIGRELGILPRSILDEIPALLNTYRYSGESK